MVAAACALLGAPRVLAASSAQTVVTGTVTAGLGVETSPSGDYRSSSNVPVVVHRETTGQTVVITVIPR